MPDLLAFLAGAFVTASGIFGFAYWFSMKRDDPLKFPPAFSDRPALSLAALALAAAVGAVLALAAAALAAAWWLSGTWGYK